MVIYFIRHGETELNKQKRLQGQSDIPLNDYGRELAKITGEALKEVPFDIVFSSPLIRAKETAEIVIGNKQVPIILEDRIKEISFGDYEGLCYNKEGYNIPEPNFLRFFEAPQLYNVPPHGEHFYDVIKRCGDFWTDLLQNKDYQNKTILVSTHGCALKAILANLRPTAVENFWGNGVHKNCAVTIVDVSDDKIEILKEGQIYY